MTDSTENAATPKSTRSRNSNLVHIQIRPKSQCKFVPQDTEESEFLELVDFNCASFSGETVIAAQNILSFTYHIILPQRYFFVK